jgi:hypothetical protein
MFEVIKKTRYLLTPKAGPTKSIRLWCYRANELGVYRVSLAHEQMFKTEQHVSGIRNYLIILGRIR